MHELAQLPPRMDHTTANTYAAPARVRKVGGGDARGVMGRMNARTEWCRRGSSGGRGVKGAEAAAAA